MTPATGKDTCQYKRKRITCLNPACMNGDNGTPKTYFSYDPQFHKYCSIECFEIVECTPAQRQAWARFHAEWRAQHGT